MRAREVDVDQSIFHVDTLSVGMSVGQTVLQRTTTTKKNKEEEEIYIQVIKTSSSHSHFDRSKGGSQVESL